MATSAIGNRIDRLLEETVTLLLFLERWLESEIQTSRLRIELRKRRPGMDTNIDTVGTVNTVQI
jgi:hypothetical protein